MYLLLLDIYYILKLNKSFISFGCFGDRYVIDIKEYLINITGQYYEYYEQRNIYYQDDD